MPNVLARTWRKIWQMDDNHLGGKRNYKTDFEIYNQNSAEIYIGCSIIFLCDNIWI
jgi:predicted transcriptional regulator YdeE